MMKNKRIPFNDTDIRVLIEDDGGVHRVCIEDICFILKRRIMIERGQAQTLCPSSIKIATRKKGLEYWYSYPYEIPKLLSHVSKENKNIAKVCTQLETWIANLPIKSAPKIAVILEKKDMTPVTYSYHDQPISFKAENGRAYVNSTQMAKSFGKNPREWLLLAEVTRFRQNLVDMGKSVDFEGQILTTRGKQGATWIEESLALEFSKWLSPDFLNWCNDRIQELFTQGYTTIPDPIETQTTNVDVPYKHQVPKTFKEALLLAAALQEEVEQKDLLIEQSKHKVDYYNEVIENRDWFKSTFIAEELQISTIQLHRFLVEKKVCKYEKKQYNVYSSHSALQCEIPYLWTNKHGKTYAYGKTKRWTQVGREYIHELWKKDNPQY